MDNPTAADIERWLDQLDPNDPTVAVYNVEHLSSAANQLRKAVADARSEGVSWGVIGMIVGISGGDAQRQFNEE